MSNYNRNSKYNYGMDYIGDTPQDPMDVVIATALRQTGEEWRRRNGTADHIVDNVTVGSIGAGIRAFVPNDPNDPGVVAISLDLEDDDEFYDILPQKAEKMDPICEPTPTECKYCLESPCVLNWKDDALDPERSLYDYLMWRGEEMIDAGHLPREVRYELYQTASKFHHGFLGKGNRKELPTCITGEIKDSFPAPGGNYTGFKKGFLN
jgi:hypothetical protein